MAVTPIASIRKVEADESRVAAVTSSAQPVTARPKSIMCGRRLSSTRRAGWTVENHHSVTPEATSVAMCTLSGPAKNVSQMRTADAVMPKASDVDTHTALRAAAISVIPGAAVATG